MKRFLLALLLCLSASTPAQARPGLLVFNTGEELFKVAGFPAELLARFPDAKADEVGYKCSHFGLFWADIWTWDCKLVAVSPNDSYSDLPESVVATLAAAPEYALKHAKRGFWNHYAFLSLIAAAVLLRVLGMFSKG